MIQLFRGRMFAVALTVIFASLWPVWAVLIGLLIQWGAGL